MAHVAMVAFTHYHSDPRVRREAEALADRGDAVDVICLRGREHPRREVVDGVNIWGAYSPRYRGPHPALYGLQYLVFLLVAMFALVRLHRGNRVDVVQVHTLPDFMVFCAMPLAWRGVPVILDMHDLMPELYADKFGGAGNLVRVLQWVERASIRFADRVIVVTHPHRRVLVDRGDPADKIVVVHNMPDPSRFPLQSPRARSRSTDGRIRFVYHGTIAARHGLDVAVMATDIARRELPGVELLIIGDGDAADQVERLIEELDLHDQVTLSRGFVPVEELLPRLLECDAGVVPVIDGPFTQYMLPTKLLEYSALGMPTICTSLAAVLEYFDENQVALVPSGDVEALAAAMVELGSDPDRAAALAIGAASFFGSHGWETEQQRHRDLVDELVDRGRRG
jgi:glycosyltransferase involved in cell wall biosynthesis